MRNFRKKKFPVLRKLRKKIAQNHANSLRFMRKNSAKVHKKNLHENSANFAQNIQPFRGNPSYKTFYEMSFREKTFLKNNIQSLEFYQYNVKIGLIKKNSFSHADL